VSEERRPLLADEVVGRSRAYFPVLSLELCLALADPSR
jgi:hypothetical protein